MQTDAHEVRTHQVQTLHCAHTNDTNILLPSHQRAALRNTEFAARQPPVVEEELEGGNAILSRSRRIGVRTANVGERPNPMHVSPLRSGLQESRSSEAPVHPKPPSKSWRVDWNVQRLAA